MSWKPEVLVDNKWSQNALVFATKEEAEANARDLMGRWVKVCDCRAVESELPVNYAWRDGKLLGVEDAQREPEEGDDIDEDEDEDYFDEDEEWDDRTMFADPGGRSALRAATVDNPRNLPCPNCKTPNRLTPEDKRLGYQCDRCADRAERGFD